jgi:tetratricopeptide (TPR) repeat protein
MSGAIRDKEKILEGDRLDGKAKSACEREDFEEAYDLYSRAGDLYRDGFNWPGDKVFFAQQDALRCLEHLIDGERLDFYKTYRERADEFFGQWDEDKIKTLLGRGYRGEFEFRIGQALAFRLWRLSFFSNSPEFCIAGSRAGAGDFQEARRILDKLIEKLGSDADQESDALLAEARSKREMLIVKEELWKPRAQRNIDALIAGYKNAADVCQLPEATRSRQRERIAALSDWYRSHQYKFMAFKILGERIIQPALKLTEAEQNFAKAVEHAKNAISDRIGDEFPRFHLFYLTYWHNVVGERLHLLCFMNEGDDSKVSELYNSAVQEWKEAKDAAEKISKLHGEDSIFPNRFYSIRDLEIEGEFLKASYDLRHSVSAREKLNDCTTRLHNCCTSFPIEYYLTWRHINLYVRFLAVKALQAYMNRDQKELSDICIKLAAACSEPIGTAARTLHNEAERLLLKLRGDLPFSENDFSVFWMAFPLDSYMDAPQTEKETEKLHPLLSVPPTIYGWVKQAGIVTNHTNLDEVEAHKKRLLGSMESLLVCCCDYYSQGFSSDKQEDLQKLIAEHNVEALVDSFSLLAGSIWKGEKACGALTGLREGLKHLREAKDVESYEIAHSKTRSSIIELARIAPVVVKIDSTAPVERLPIEDLPAWLTVRPSATYIEKPRILEAKPDWSVPQDTRRGRGKIFISLPAEVSLEPGKYYLHPDWRKGNRIFYPVGKECQLFPVRFEPKWDYWEKGAGQAFLDKIRDRLVIVLGKYGGSEEDELRKVRDHLQRNKNYNAYLVKDFTDYPDIASESKSFHWIDNSRFCVMIDRGTLKGSLVEAGYIQHAIDKAKFLAVLNCQGKFSDMGLKAAYVNNVSWVNFFAFENSFTERIDEAVDWAEKKLEDRVNRKKSVE